MLDEVDDVGDDIEEDRKWSVGETWTKTAIAAKPLGWSDASVQLLYNCEL